MCVYSELSWFLLSAFFAMALPIISAHSIAASAPMNGRCVRPGEVVDSKQRVACSPGEEYVDALGKCAAQCGNQAWRLADGRDAHRKDLVHGHRQT